MNQDDVIRIMDAFEAFNYNSIPCEAADPDQCQADAEVLRKRYHELRGTRSFAEAARIAKSEFMLSVSEGKSEPKYVDNDFRVALNYTADLLEQMDAGGILPDLLRQYANEIESALKTAKEALAGAVTSHSRGCQIYLKRECDCWLADRREALARIGKLL